MRVIKLAIISFIVFFVILFLMSLLIPSHVRISRAINMEAPSSEITPLLSDTTRWSEWMTMNTEKVKVYREETKQGIISTRWHYGGRDIISSFRIEESGGITVVQWYFDFHLKWYPWEKFGSITFDKQFGPLMESSLNNLKKVMENSP